MGGSKKRYNTGDMDAAAMTKVSSALKQESLKRKSGQMTQMKEKAAQRLLEKKARGMISFDADAPTAAGDGAAVDEDAVGGGVQKQQVWHLQQQEMVQQQFWHRQQQELVQMQQQKRLKKQRSENEASLMVCNCLE